jgi:RNA polymerase sigma-70 factor (ECF subfamily)
MKETELIRCELLVLSHRRGRRDEAARDLVALFQRPVLYYVRRLVQSEDDAWDVLQETFVSVLKAINTLRDPRALPAFVYRTARNAAFGHERRRRRDEPITEDVEEMIEAEVDNEPFDEADAERLHRALETLPMPQREALTLFFLRDLTLEQIADISGVSIGTVKSRLHYAKRTLRQRLDGGGQ